MYYLYIYMLDIFKLYINNINKINEVYLFSKSFVNIKEKFKYDIDEFILSNIYKTNSDILNTNEIDLLKKDNSTIYLCDTNIFFDDTIEFVKFKFLKYYNKYNKPISFESLYFYSITKNKNFDIKNFFDFLNKNHNYKEKFITYFSNIQNISIQQLELDKIFKDDTINYKLLLDLKFDDFIINKQLGHTVNDDYYSFIVNLYDIYDNKNIQDINSDINTNNNNLLFEYNIINNSIYIIKYDDVIEYNKTYNYNIKLITKLYFPFLYNINIISNDDYYENKDKLLEKSNNILDSKEFNSKNEIIDLMYLIQKDNQKINYNYIGVKSILFDINNTNNNYNLPLEYIFKIFNSNKNIPFIKYNPGKLQENIYRLYSPYISKDNKKIPYYNKTKIFKYVRNIGKNNKIAFVINDPNNFIVELDKKGLLTVSIEFINTIDVQEIDKYINGKINYIINILKFNLDSIGFTINKYNSLLDNNINIKNIDYLFNMNINNFDIETYKFCLNSLFNIINSNDNKNKIKTMRYKRVSNYNLYNAIDSFIIELLKNNYNQDEICYKLKENFDMKIDDAKSKFLDVVHSLELESDIFNFKTLKIKNNPGFKTTVYPEKFTSNKIIYIQNIDNIYYLKFIPLYIDSILKIFIKKFSNKDILNQINSICKIKTKVNDDILIKDFDTSKKIYKDEEDDDDLIDNYNDDDIDDVLQNTDDNFLDLLLNDDDDDDDDDVINDDVINDDVINDDVINDDVINDDVINDDVIDKTEYIEKLNSDLDKEVDKQYNTNYSKYDEDSDDGDSNDSDTGDDGVKDEKKDNNVTNIGSKIDIQGMNLHPNPALKRLVKREPKLFLNNDNPFFTTYSRICPANVKRQPIILTQEEKDYIDKNHKNSYTNTFQYGTDKKYWYICPRYWDLQRNVSLTKEQVESGLFGKIIPSNAKKVPKDANIYEFNDDKVHIDPKTKEYIEYSPGFLIDKHNTKEGNCIPCCFKDWNSKVQEKYRKQCLENVKEDNSKKKDHFYEYVKGPEKFPLDKYKLGLLPLSIQYFLQFDNYKCINKKNNILNQNYECLLRYGVEKNEKQSFISCIADVYGNTILNKNITSKEMKEYIISSLNIDNYIKYNNGNLVQIFKSKKENIDNLLESIDINKYNDQKYYKNIDIKNENQVRLYKTIINSLNNFINYLKNDDIVIDYTYLWDIICTPNPLLFPYGLNLIVLETCNNDITNNVNVVCPKQFYVNEVLDFRKYNLILLKQNKIFEPIYSITETNLSYSIKRTFSFSIINNNLNYFKKILNTIKYHIDNNCKSQYTSLDKFKSNTNLNYIVNLLIKNKFEILYQISNYHSKIIGIVVKNFEIIDNKSFFVPCYPSSIYDSFDIPIKFMDDYRDNYYNNYFDTIQSLITIYNLSNKKINVNPYIKIYENNLLVGILTNANQFVMLKEPEFIKDNDELISVNDSNLMVIDNFIQTYNNDNDNDTDYVSNLKLDINFYKAFTDTFKYIFKNIAYYKEKITLNEILNNNHSTYKNKIDNVNSMLKTIGEKYFMFVKYDKQILKLITDVNICNNNVCDSNYCYKNKEGSDCKLIIPEYNLINDNFKNEIVYYNKFSDELVRNNYSRLFVLGDNEMYKFNNINYNITNQEILIFHSLLTQDFFENLIIDDIKNNSINYNILDKYDTNLKKVLNLDAVDKIEDIYKINDMLSKNKLSLNIINKSNVDIIKKSNIPETSDSDSKSKSKPHHILESNDVKVDYKDDVDELTKTDLTNDDPDKLEVDSVIETIVPGCKLVRFNVREKLLKNYFAENLYEMFSNNASRVCTFNTLLLLLKQNNITISVIEIKNLLVKLYSECPYNKIFLEKHILKQKKDKLLDPVKKIDLFTYILSENYYISMIDIYFILKHFKIPHIFICTTNIPIANGYNFLVGYYNNNNNNYHMIKIDSSHKRPTKSLNSTTPTNNIINYKLLMYIDNLAISINSIKETEDNFKNKLLTFINANEKLDMYDKFLKT